MNKLPVGKAAIDAVTFSFINIFSTIRLGWLGFVLFLAIYGIGLVLAFGGLDPEIFESLEYAAEDPHEMAEALHELMGAYSGSILVSMVASIMFVPALVILTRMAADGVEAPRGIAYLKFGGREVSYILGYILACIVYTIVTVLVFGPALIALGIGLFSGVPPEVFADAATNPEALGEAIEANVEGGQFGMAGVIGLLFGLIGIILLIWFSLRMTTFLPTIAVENRIALFSSLRMTKGNVWRIVGAILLLLVIAMGVMIAFYVGVALIVVAFGLLYSALNEVSEILGYVTIAVGGALGVFVYLLLIAFAVAMEIAFPAQIYKHLRGNAE